MLRTILFEFLVETMLISRDWKLYFCLLYIRWVIYKNNPFQIKGISNIYLKVTIEKNWSFQNFGFLSLKNLSPGQFLGISFSREFWNFLLQLKNQRSGTNALLFYFAFAFLNFERNYDVLKSKRPCILLNKSINFKTKYKRRQNEIKNGKYCT